MKALDLNARDFVVKRVRVHCAAALHIAKCLTAASGAASFPAHQREHTHTLTLAQNTILRQKKQLFDYGVSSPTLLPLSGLVSVSPLLRLPPLGVLSRCSAPALAGSALPLTLLSAADFVPSLRSSLQ